MDFVRLLRASQWDHLCVLKFIWCNLLHNFIFNEPKLWRYGVLEWKVHAPFFQICLVLK